MCVTSRRSEGGSKNSEVSQVLRGTVERPGGVQPRGVHYLFICFVGEGIVAMIQMYEMQIIFSSPV